MRTIRFLIQGSWRVHIGSGVDVGAFCFVAVLSLGLGDDLKSPLGPKEGLCRAVPVGWVVLFVGVLRLRAVLFGFEINPLIFGNSHVAGAEVGTLMKGTTLVQDPAPLHRSSILCSRLRRGS